MAFLPFSNDAKVWEPIAQSLRGLLPPPHRTTARFNPWLLAPIVGLAVVEYRDQGLSADEAAYMAKLDGDHWSGGVFPIPLPNGGKICILNPAQSLGRRKVTLMEEVCHCHLGHSATKLVKVGGEYVRDFEKSQERQAFGVAAAVLMPWKLLFPHINTGANYVDLSNEFEVTEALAEYRIKICGASSLYRKRQVRGGSS